MKTNVKALVSFFACVMLVGSFMADCCSAAGFFSSSGKQDKFVIKAGYVLPASSAGGQAFELFKKLVEERTKGGIEVHLFPASALGNERDLIENVNSGSIQMITVGTSALATVYYPELAVVEAPFLFRNPEHCMKVARGENCISEMRQGLYDKTNIMILDWWYRSPRHVYTRNKPIVEPGDTAGVKLRVPEIDLYFEAMARIGFSVTPVAYGEVYGALQQGVVDGLEGALDLTWGSKFQEVVKYASLLGWNGGFAPVAINKNFFNKLPKEYQAILTESMREAADFNTKESLRNEEKLVGMFRGAGVEIITPNVEAFRSKVKGIIPAISHIWKDGGRDFYGQIQAIGQ